MIAKRFVVRIKGANGTKSTFNKDNLYLLPPSSQFTGKAAEAQKGEVTSSRAQPGY